MKNIIIKLIKNGGYMKIRINENLNKIVFFNSRDYKKGEVFTVDEEATKMMKTGYVVSFNNGQVIDFIPLEYAEII